MLIQGKSTLMKRYFHVMVKDRCDMPLLFEVKVGKIFRIAVDKKLQAA